MRSGGKDDALVDVMSVVRCIMAKSISPTPTLTPASCSRRRLSTCHRPSDLLNAGAKGVSRGAVRGQDVRTEAKRQGA